MKLSSSPTLRIVGKPAGWMAKLGLLLASLALALLAVEACTRLMFEVPMSSVENWVVHRTSLLKAHANAVYDPLLGWILRPGLMSDLEPGGIASGEFGIRMNQFKISKVPRGGILCSGDSFTAGSEVGDADTWPAHLEKIIKTPVVNAAAGGWGSDQIILRVESLLDPLDPKAVVVSFLVDDIQRVKYRIYGGANKPWFELKDGELIPHNNPVPIFSGKVDEIGFWRSVFGHSFFLTKLAERLAWKAWWLDGQVYVEEPVDAVAVTVALMKRLNYNLSDRGIPLIFLLQYGGSQITQWKDEPDWAKKTYLGIESLGIPTVNTWGPLRKLHTERGQPALDKLYVMRDNGKIHGHMSSEGNKFVAELIAPALLKVLEDKKTSPWPEGTTKKPIKIRATPFTSP